MSARRPVSRNNHLEEAMALLIRNQAAFVEQIARNDQERLKLQFRAEDWQRKAEVRFENIERRLEKIEATLVAMPKTILKTVIEQLPKIIVRDVLAKLPKAVKKEIGFTPSTR
jgi:hypothetical protein